MSSFSSTTFYTEHQTSVPNKTNTNLTSSPSSYSFFLKRNDQHYFCPVMSRTFHRNENALQQDHRPVFIRKFPVETRTYCQDDETKEKNEKNQADEFSSRQTITVRQIDCQDMKHSSLPRNDELTDENERDETVNIQRSSTKIHQFPTHLAFTLPTIPSALTSSSAPFLSHDRQVADNDDSNPVLLISSMDLSGKKNDSVCNPCLNRTTSRKQIDSTMISTDQIEILVNQLSRCLGQLTNLLKGKRKKNKKKKRIKQRSKRHDVLLRENIIVKRCASSFEPTQPVLSSVPKNSIFLRSDQDDLQRCLLIYCRNGSKCMKSKQKFSSPSFTHFDDQEERFAQRTINTNGNKSFSSYTWNHLPIKRYSSTVLSSSTMANNLSDDVLLLPSKKTLMLADDDYEAFNELEQSLNGTEDD